MEVGNTTESWASTTNHHKICKGIEKIFLGRDEWIKRVNTGDGNEIGQVRKGVKPF